MKIFQSISLWAALLTPGLAAQAITYDLDPAVLVGGYLRSAVSGKSSQPFVVFWGTKTGPLQVFGETLWVGLGPSFYLGRVGLLDVTGRDQQKLQVPPATGLAGLILFGQALGVDASSPNGMFRLSNGESTIIHNESNVLVHAFDDPKREGFTGSFDLTVKGRLTAGTMTKRLVRPQLSAGGTKFGSPLQGPVGKFGGRIQMVYRANDLGGSGGPEALTGVHWRPFGGVVTADSLGLMRIDVGHSPKVPDYRVGPISALPLYPNSGLENTFLRNQKAQEAQVKWVDSPYSFTAGSLRPDGYVPYPAPSNVFIWNGKESLLLDFKVPVSLSTKATNGQQVYLMVLSAPKPSSRAYIFGSPNHHLDPLKAHTAYNSDNTLYDYQLEFTRVQTVAVSPWIDSKRTAPNYSLPSVAASIPLGTRVELEFSGARDQRGTGATAYSANIDQADGYPFIRYRVHFRSSVMTQQRPSIDSIVIPAR